MALSSIKNGYGHIAKAENLLQPIFLLIIRLYWGWQFFLTGRNKLMHIDATADFFTNLGIPWPLANAYLVGSVEAIGGILLILGLFTRIATIPLAFTMLVALATAHRDVFLNLFSRPDDFLSQEAFQFLFAILIVMIFGAGKLSLDYLFFREKA